MAQHGFEFNYREKHNRVETVPHLDGNYSIWRSLLQKLQIPSSPEITKYKGAIKRTNSKPDSVLQTFLFLAILEDLVSN